MAGGRGKGLRHDKPTGAAGRDTSRVPLTLRVEDPATAGSPCASAAIWTCPTRRCGAGTARGCSSCRNWRSSGSSTSSRSSTPTAAASTIARSGQPAAGAGRVRREVRARGAGLRAAGVARRAAASQGARASVLIRGRGARGASRSRVWAPADADGRRRCRCWSPTTARSTTRSPALTRYAGAMIAAGALPPLRRRAAAAGRPQRVVLGVGALRAARCAAHAAGAARRRSPCVGPPVGMGASLGGAGDAARPAPLPGHVRRRCSCSRASFFVPRYRPAGVGLLALRADHAASSRGDAARRRSTRPGPGRDDLRRRGGERRTTTALMARRSPPGLRRVAATRCPDLHNYTGWRDALRPAPDRVLLRLDAMNAHTRAVLAGDRRVGTVVAYGHWGRPVLVFPAEGGGAGDYEDSGMVGAVGDLIEAGRVKLYCVDSFDAASWSNHDDPARGARPRSTALRAWILDQVVPFIHDDCGGARRSSPPGSASGAFHAANFALKRADLFPLAICLSGNYDPSTWDGWGERGDARLLQQPDRLRRPPARRPPRLAALAAQPAAGLRPGPVGGHDRRRWSPRAPRRRCSRRRASGTSSTCGATTSRTTGRPGARSSPTICRGSADDRHDAPDRPAARHRGGLAARVRDAALAARADRRCGGTTHHARRPSGSRSSRSTCATSRATTSSSTGSPTGTTSRASG